MGTTIGISYASSLCFDISRIIEVGRNCQNLLSLYRYIHIVTWLYGGELSAIKKGEIILFSSTMWLDAMTCCGFSKSHRLAKECVTLFLNNYYSL